MFVFLFVGWLVFSNGISHKILVFKQILVKLLLLKSKEDSGSSAFLDNFLEIFIVPTYPQIPPVEPSNAKEQNLNTIVSDHTQM